MKARIYKPAKNAMQSGEFGKDSWLFEYAPEQKKFIDPLMGWTGSSDTKQQLRLKFDSKDAAIAYAERKNIPYEVEEPQTRKQNKRAYADNFAFKQVDPTGG